MSASMARRYFSSSGYHPLARRLPSSRTARREQARGLPPHQLLVNLEHRFTGGVHQKNLYLRLP
ncbi:hypothetical protein KCP76_25830 [Salmonella enterica subsp. enterica serovar Weltevreden]|nr:hypothetical protein KCP76_25830 [Salmonella enterica subsp. enterica serovar Weltevreden]